MAFLNIVSTFGRQHILTCETYFLFYHQNEVWYYGEYSNTSLKGTNLGIKLSSISTHPRLSMENLMIYLLWKQSWNRRKSYYRFPDQYGHSNDYYNSFIWESEVEHGKYVKCECGQVFKKEKMPEGSRTYL